MFLSISSSNQPIHIQKILYSLSSLLPLVFSHMESLSELTNYPLPHSIVTLPVIQIAKYLQIPALEILSFSVFMLVIRIVTYFVVLEYEQFLHFYIPSCVFFFFILEHFHSRTNPVYLVDFSCFKPPCFCRVPFSCFLENASLINIFNNESIDFMAKILASSGQSQEAYLPPALHYIPPKTHQDESIKEVHMVLFPIMDDLLSKTKVSPCDIDILIVNCGGFSPAPSLTSIIVNKYKMKSDIKTYNLSGMGCSASPIAIDMAGHLLKVHRGVNAVVLSTEILSTGWYSGSEKSKLLLNCHFRMGSAALLLTNKKEARKSAKYKLCKTVRTQRASDDKAYYAAFREEDSSGILGVTLRRDVLQVADDLLRSNITVLGSSVLPFSEKLRHGLSVIFRKFINEIYVPNFKTVIQHFCLPTSGKQLIMEIAKGLKLSERDMEPALMTLHRFGNQSSSSLWYELAYLEAKDRMKKGDKVWQMGMGSGSKCNSVVWECLRTIVGESENGPWADSIHRYPSAEAAKS